MSASNGVIRIGRKGLKKFAFGEDGTPFEVDVVVAFQQWIIIDEAFRPIEPDAKNERNIPQVEMPAYHQSAVVFVQQLATDPNTTNSVIAPQITVSEALDFIARLREQYTEMLSFFQPRSRDEPDLPATSEVGLRFSVEPTEQS